MCCCSHHVLPGSGRFLSTIPETFELVPLGCHHFSSQSPQCFLRNDFLSSPAASPVHQNSLLRFTEPALCTNLQLPRVSIINAKVNPPKSPRPLSLRNEIEWRINHKSPASTSAGLKKWSVLYLQKPGRTLCVSLS